MAEGGIAAALANVDERDNWKVHFADTMRGGQYVNQWRMAELHAKEAPDRVRELEAWGAVFDRTKDGRILQRHFGGHKYPRLAHVGDRTGLEMIRTLQDHGVHRGIDVHMEHTILALLKDGDRVVGAFGYERERGRFKVFRAKAIVLATGGIGRAYKITSNSWEYTGDGHTLAYEAGAELIDMEFVQFHPTGMVWPPSVRGILVTEAVRGDGGILVNSKGRRFMFDDIPELYRAQTASDEDAVRHGGRARGRRDAEVGRPGPVRRRRMRGGHQRRQSPGRQFPFRSPRLRQARRRVCREIRAIVRRGRRDSGAASRRGRPGRARAVRARRAGRRTLPGPVRATGNDAGPRRHRQNRSGHAARTRRARSVSRPGAPRRRRRPSRIQSRLACRARSPKPAACVRGGHSRRNRAA